MRYKMQSFIILSLFSLIASICAGAQEQRIDPALAQKYFQEAAMICKEDNGKLWGHSLCGPMIFFDPATRTVVANQSDKEGRLTKKGDVFVGRVPDEVNCANTAIDWAGVRWSMIFWLYLGEDKYDRDRLMIHESFHRIQQEMGLPMSNPSNNHLDSMEGRIWLQLEWRALRQALMHQDRERRDAVADALIFRLYRRALFAQAATEEKALEMNEGLAEYTGVKLSGRADAELDAFIARRLQYVNERPTFTRSFAYESGPAYGLLLDGTNLNWRRHLKSSDDLGELLQKTFSLKLPDDLKAEAEKRAAKYDGENLRAAELKREQERLARIAAYRAKLVEGAHLILPLSKDVNYSFNPNNLVPLDNSGTIYPTMRVTDAWGILDVKGGALMVRENNKPALLYVPVASDNNARPLQGDGWTLQLNDGWMLEPAERKGDYTLKVK
jgi:phage tail protein X